MLLRIALLFVLVLAAPAHAQWSPPRAVGGSQIGYAPAVAIARDGSSLVTWRETIDEKTQSAALAAAGRGAIAGPLFDVAGPVAAGRGFAYAWTSPDQRRLYARTGGSRLEVATGRRLAGPVIAANARGRVALAWFDDRGTSNDEVMVSLARHGGRFGKPLRLGRGSVRSVSVAVGPEGAVLVAWNAAGRVHARLRRRGRFGRAQTIRSHEAHGARLRTVLLDGGAIVGWTAKFRSEGGEARDAFAEIALRPAGARRFNRAQLLARHGGERGELRIDPLLGHVAWTTPQGMHVTYIEEEYVLPGVRTGPEGAELVDFAAGSLVYAHGGRIHVDGDAVSGPGASDAAVAVHPRTHRLALAWVQDGRVMTATQE